MDAPERPTQAEPKPVAANARRKLIRGAFALPAMAAVHSGSALAASSSLRCLTNGLTGSNAPAVTYPPAPVVYLSIALAIFRKPRVAEAGVFDYRHYVAGSVVLSAASTIASTSGSPLSVDSNFITSGNYRLFNVGQNITSGPIIPLITAQEDGYVLVSDPNASPAVPNLMRPSAALIFDKSAKTIVGVGIVGGSEAFAATQSCWTSFGTV